MTADQQHEWAIFNVEHHPDVRHPIPKWFFVALALFAMLLASVTQSHCQEITPNVAKTQIISPVDGSGNVKVDCITGCAGGSGGNPAAGPTGSAVPSDADYLGFNVSGNLAGVSASNPLPITSLQLPASLDTNGYLKIHEQGTANVNVTNGSIAVTGTFWQPTQPVSGTVAVSNFPSTQPVSGTFWQTTQPVSLTGSWPYSGALGSVSVSNFPATQPVSGTVTANQGGAPWSVTGTGSAGSPASGVVSVQGVSGGTAVPISGTVTTSPPSNASANVSQFGGSNVVTGTGVSGSGIPRVTVSSDSFPATQPVSGTVTANQGGAPWADNVTQIGGSPIALGPAPPQQSIPVVIDNLATQPIVVSVNGTPTVKLSNGPMTPLYVNNQTPVLYAIMNGVLTPVLLVQGQAPMAQSLPVTIASNQSAVPASQSGTWAVTAQAVPSGAPMPATPAPISLSTNGALIVTSAPTGLPLPPCNPVRTTNCQHF